MPHHMNSVFSSLYTYMDVPNGENDNDWVQKVKYEGAVPFLDPENCSNGWSTPNGDIFMVRGPNYFSDKVKIPGGKYLLEPFGLDWLKGTKKISEVLNHSNHRVRKAIDEATSSGREPFIFAFNLQLPSKDNYSAIFYFVSLKPIQDGSLLDQFIKGDDTFRKSRLKLIANIVQGPWIVRKAVGEQAICVINRALSCKYVTGSNYIEVDIDVGSSVVANAIVHLALGYITTLTVDLAFLIESQTQDELPERILGAVRFSELKIDSAEPYEMPPEETHLISQSSLPTRLWQSIIGQGFSNLLQQSNQEDSNENFEDCDDNISN